MSRGRFIVFEGTEACGKSTQIKLLAGVLTSQGREVLALREPGGTDIGEECRAILKHSKQPLTMATELFLMNASRSQLVSQRILPALEMGTDVLLDRYFYSTVAYQGYGRRLPMDEVYTVVKLATQGLTPDVVFLLKVPLAVSEARRNRRQEVLPFKPGEIDRFEQEHAEFFRRVEAGYEAMAADETHLFQKIDATQSIEQVHAQILAGLEEKLATQILEELRVEVLR